LLTTTVSRTAHIRIEIDEATPIETAETMVALVAAVVAAVVAVVAAVVAVVAAVVAVVNAAVAVATMYPKPANTRI